MVIDDFHFVAVASAPDETDAPLVIDADRVLTCTVAIESLELVSRGRSQKAKLARGVYLEEFPKGHTFNRTGAFATVVKEKLLRVATAEAPDRNRML